MNMAMKAEEKQAQKFQEIQQRINDAKKRKSTVEEWKIIIMSACDLPRRQELEIEEKVISGIKESFNSFEEGLELCNEGLRGGLGRKFAEAGHEIMKKNCKGKASEQRMVEDYINKFAFERQQVTAG